MTLEEQIYLQWKGRPHARISWVLLLTNLGLNLEAKKDIFNEPTSTITADITVITFLSAPQSKNKITDTSK